MRTERRAARAFVLALATLACAFASATAALAGMLHTVPPTDEAYGMSVWELWGDPFVRLIAVPGALSGAVVGYLAALLLLWRTRLSRSLPLVFTVTVVVAGVVGSVAPLLGLIAALICATGVMMWCRMHFADNLRTR